MNNNNLWPEGQDPGYCLQQVPGFERHVQLQPLPGGLSNRIWRVDRGGQSYVLRLHNPQPAAGIDRRRERDAWHKAASAGLSPALIHWDSEDRFSLSAYVAAKPCSRPLPHETAALLAKLHALPPCTAETRNYAQIAHHLGRQLPQEDRIISDWLDHAWQWQEALHHPQLNGGLCHHDASRENLLYDGARLWLVDFEYAQAGSALFDLATTAEHWPPAARRQLLSAYLQARQLAHDAVVEEAFHSAQALHLLLSLLWWQGRPPCPQSIRASHHYRDRMVQLLIQVGTTQ